MKTLTVIIERNEEAFFAYMEDLEGCVAGGDSYEEVKTNIEEILALMAEEDNTVKELLKKGFTLNFVVDLESVFELIPEVNITQLAKTGNLNPGLLRQYVSGAKKASEKQTEKIMHAIKVLSQKLNTISLTP